jgi:hypothetical protein
MSNYRSMIDEALQSARARIDGGSADLMKTASAPENSMVKEASELADALEYVAHASTKTGSAADAVRGEMIRSFFKSAAGSPAQSSTSVQGTQGQTTNGKKIPARGVSVGGSPPQSETGPAAADGKKPLLESYKQAEGQSLYDILMGSKTAGRGGPAEMSASEDAFGIPSGNENSNYRSILHSNEGPVNMTKRTAKGPVRARLAEAFAYTGDTSADADIAAVFPQGARAGTHKVATASLLEALTKEASLEGISPFALLVKLAGLSKKQKRKRRAQVMNAQNRTTAAAQTRRGVAPENISLAHNQSDINRKAQGKGGRVASSAKPAAPLSLKVPHGGAARVESLEPTARIKKRQAFQAAREKRLGSRQAAKQRRFEQKRSKRARIMEKRQVRQRTQAVRGPVAKAPSIAQVVAPRQIGARLPSQEAVAKMPKAMQRTPAPQQVSDAAVIRAGGTPVAPGQKRTAYTPKQVKERRVTLNNQQRTAKGLEPKPGGTTTPVIQQNMKDKVKASRSGGGGGAPRPKPSAGGLKRFMTARNVGGAAAAAGVLGGGAYLLNKRRQENA